jgi:hypothetical protein
MIEQEYIMLIMNCTKYQKKALFQKMTWLKLIPPYLRFYHVIGDETLDSTYKFDNENNLLLVKTADDYNSLPKKVVAAYNAVNETFNYKYIFKTDDDQILVNNNFINILTNILNKNTNTQNVIHYGGYIVDVKQNYLSQYFKLHPELPQYLPILKTKYCSGRFYFLSKEAVLKLLLKKEYIEKEYLEDYAIGFHLNPNYKINILHLETNKFFTDIELSDFPRLIAENKI